MKTIICKYCKKEFKTKKLCKSRVPKYCNKKCYGESLKLNIPCKKCGGIIKNKHGVSIKNRIYCSKQCQSEARKKIPLSAEWKLAISLSRKKSDRCKGVNLYNYIGGNENTKRLVKERYMRTRHNVVGRLPVEYLRSILLVQENKCFYCDAHLNDYKAIEHLTPLTRGGKNQPYNLVYSCKSCNSNKRQQTLEEYAINKNRIDWVDKFDFIYSSTLQRQNSDAKAGKCKAV